MARGPAGAPSGATFFQRESTATASTLSPPVSQSEISWRKGRYPPRCSGKACPLIAGDAPVITPSNCTNSRRFLNSLGSEKCRRYAQTSSQAAGSQSCQESLATQCGRVILEKPSSLNCRFVASSLSFPPNNQSPSSGTRQPAGPVRDAAFAVRGRNKEPPAKGTRLPAAQVRTKSRRDDRCCLVFIFHSKSRSFLSFIGTAQDETAESWAAKDDGLSHPFAQS